MSTAWPPTIGWCGVAVLVCCAAGCVARTSGEIDAHVLTDPRTVSATQLARWSDLALDDALERANVNLLRRDFRGAPVAVYVDRMPASFAELHRIPARIVADVRLEQTSEAQMDLGPLVWQPVLHVRLRHLDR